MSKTILKIQLTLISLLISLNSYTQKPNIILICPEGTGKDIMENHQLWTNKPLTTNINSLREKSFSFNNAFINVSDYQSALQSILSGRYPQNNGSWASDLIEDSISTIPKILKKNNFICSYVGSSIYISEFSAYSWDNIIDEKNINWKIKMNEIIKQSKSADKSFFMLYCPKLENKKGSITTKDVKIPLFMPQLDELKENIAQYCNSISYIDKKTGELISALKNSSKAENTIIIFASASSYPFPFATQNCYPHSNRISLFIKLPATTKTAKTDNKHFVSGIDIMPTINEILQIKTAVPTDGKSLLPLIKGKNENNRDAVYTLFNGTKSGRSYAMRSIHTAEFVYIVNLWANWQNKYKADDLQDGIMEKIIRNSLGNDKLMKLIKFYQTRTTEELYIYPEDKDALKNEIKNNKYAPNTYKMKMKLLEKMKTYKDPYSIEYKKRFIE